MKQEILKNQKTAQDIKFSSLAQMLIADANVEFAGLDTLSSSAQQKIADLVNRTAQEQAIINDVSYGKIITATVQVADTACQSYGKGKVDLGDALINFGNTILDCTVAFSKGFKHGVDKSVQNNLDALANPLDTLTGLAEGVVHIASCVFEYEKEYITNCLHKSDLLEILSLPDSMIIDLAGKLGNKIVSGIADLAKQINDMPLVKTFEKFGEKAGELGADFVIFDGALKGASIVKNIAVVEVAAIMQKAEKNLATMGEFAKAEIAALAESREVLATTAEGFDVAVNAKRADIAREAEALHSEMSSFDKAKNSVKSESSAAKSSKAFPDRIWEGNPKHHENVKGDIGKPPRNPCKALDEAVVVKTKGNRELKTLVGIEDGKIVKFHEHSSGKYHGYIVEGKLDIHSENALKRAGLMDKSGRIK